MHALFRNVDILSRIADHLHGSPVSLHLLVPLLGVSERFRAIVEKRLVAVYRDTGVLRTGARAGQINGDGFLRFAFPFPPVRATRLTLFSFSHSIEQGEYPHSDFGPVSPRNDPRWLFTRNVKPWNDPQLTFTLTSYEKKSATCTFKAATTDNTLLFHIPVDKRTGKPLNDCCDHFDTVFIGGASTWFRPGLAANPKRFAGLEVVSRPDRHASRAVLVTPKISEKRGGNLKTGSYKCDNGWEISAYLSCSVRPPAAVLTFVLLSRLSSSLSLPAPPPRSACSDFTTKRQKVRRMFQDGEEWVAVKLQVDSIKVPLVQLFLAPTSKLDLKLNDEMTQDVEAYTLDEWESSFYDVGGH
jgi:hypothetical protein